MLTFQHRFGLNNKGEPVLREGFDIIANPVAVAPWSSHDARKLRLEQGVLDTTLEAMLLSARPGVSVENASVLFASSSSQGIDWTVVRSADDPILRTVEIPDDARSKIEGLRSEAAARDGAEKVAHDYYQLLSDDRRAEAQYRPDRHHKAASRN